MNNPWLDIPLSDYESHMAMSSIAQAGMIAAEFEALVQCHKPDAVAVIGCAGGNGFDRVTTETRRVVGVDINPAFIAAALSRYGGRIAGLELYVADIQEAPPPCAPVELIYAALVFEYVTPSAALANLARICRPGGRLCALLQLPVAGLEEISPSPYESLHALAPIMRLVEPSELVRYAAHAGFVLESETRISLASGKAFVLQQYIKPS